MVLPDYYLGKTLRLYALSQNQPTDIPSNYLIATIVIGNRKVKVLVDSGAQPAVIKESIVPLGTIVRESNVTLQGVKGPKIQIKGIADIPMEIGTSIFSATCLVVEDGAMNFPAATGMVMGNGFLAANKIDIATSKWALLKNEEVLQHLEPAWINGNLFSKAEADYANAMLDHAEDEVEEVRNSQFSESGDRDFNNDHLIRGRAPKPRKLYP